MAHKATKTWIIVSDGSHARIFSHDGPGKTLKSLDKLESSLARAQPRKTTTDAPGRSFDRGGEGRHAMEPEHNAQDAAKMDFAREVADYIDDAAHKRKFDQLIIAAAPKTLGTLRDSLAPKTKEMIAAEIDKDLTNIPANDLAPHFKNHIYVE